MKSALVDAGISSSKATHAMRGCALRLMPFVDEAKKAQLGRWASGAMDKCYADLPLEALMTLAGFEKAPYFIARAGVEPPEELQKMIFPELDEHIDLLRRGIHPDGDDNITLNCFVKTFQFLRIVILQDSVLMKELFPSLSIWNNEIFSHNLYLEFEETLKESIGSAVDPALTHLSAIAPDLINFTTRSFDAVHQSLRNQKMETIELKGITLQTRENVADLNAKIADLRSDVMNQLQTISVNVRFGDNDADASGYSGGSRNSVVPNSRNTPESSQVVELNQVSSNSEDDALVPIYEMNRNIRTVNDLWREYTIGLDDAIGSGRRRLPAVRDLEMQFGTKWRSKEKDRRFFNRRKIIYQEVERMVRDNAMTESDAVRELDRLISSNNASLDWLQRHLKEQNSNTGTQ